MDNNEIKVFDGHSDIWTDVTVRRLNGEDNILEKYHLQRLNRGNIEGAIFVIWSDPPFDSDPITRTGQIMKSISDEVSQCQQIAIVHNFAEIEQAKAAGKFYILIGAEGLSIVDNSDLDAIDMLYDFGVRHCSLTWNEENSLATGICGSEEKGLTPLGKEAVRKIMNKKMILDVSHLNEKSFWDVLKLTDKPIVATHSNSKVLCNVSRNLTDDQLKAIAESGGLVGINSFKPFISTDSTNLHLADLINHISYIADKIGTEHLAFGFDFSEFLKQETMNAFSNCDVPYIEGLEDCSKVPAILSAMSDAGFSNKEIRAIAHDNYYNIFNNIL